MGENGNEKVKESKNTVRVILNIPEELNNTFAELAKKRGLAKSHMIIFAMSWYLDYNKSMDMMPKMVDFLNNIPESLESGKEYNQGE